MNTHLFPHGQMITIHHSLGKISLTLVNRLEDHAPGAGVCDCAAPDHQLPAQASLQGAQERQKTAYRPEDDLDDELIEVPDPDPFDEDAADIDEDRADSDDDGVLFDEEMLVSSDENGD